MSFPGKADERYCYEEVDQIGLDSVNVDGFFIEAEPAVLQEPSTLRRMSTCARGLELLESHQWQNGVCIRPARGGDDAVCGKLAAAALMAGDLPQRLPHAREVFASESPLQCESGQRLIAECTGQVCGFIDFDPAENRICYLFVAPDNQRRGIASRLLQLAELRIDRPATVDVLAANSAAIQFYRQRGYRCRSIDFDADWHGGPAVWLKLFNF